MSCIMVLLYYSYFVSPAGQVTLNTQQNNYPVVVIDHTFWPIEHREVDLQGELQEPRDRPSCVQQLFDRKTAHKLGVLPSSKGL